MYNLLTDPLLPLQYTGGEGGYTTLPGALAALSLDRVQGFDDLRFHQRHAWHAFLVQLGALAMQRAGIAELPTTEGEWAYRLMALTPDWPDQEPWHLVVEDPTLPGAVAGADVVGRCLQGHGHRSRQHRHSGAVQEPRLQGGAGPRCGSGRLGLRAGLVADHGRFRRRGTLRHIPYERRHVVASRVVAHSGRSRRRRPFPERPGAVALDSSRHARPPPDGRRRHRPALDRAVERAERRGPDAGRPGPLVHRDLPARPAVRGAGPAGMPARDVAERPGGAAQAQRGVRRPVDAVRDRVRQIPDAGHRRLHLPPSDRVPVQPGEVDAAGPARAHRHGGRGRRRRGRAGAGPGTGPYQRSARPG